MANRNFEISGSDGPLTIMASGFINEADGTVTGRITRIDSDTLAVDTASITGTVTGSAPETLVFTSIAATLDLGVTGTIADVGIITAAATLDGVTAIALTGAANNRIVSHATAQHEADAAGLTALGVPADDPCALLAVLKRARWELLSGQAVSRVTAPGGRDVTFQKGDLAELAKEIARLEVECRAASGITQTPSSAPRTRRAIRFNPYL